MELGRNDDLDTIYNTTGREGRVTVFFFSPLKDDSDEIKQHGRFRDCENH